MEKKIIIIITMLFSKQYLHRLLVNFVRNQRYTVPSTDHSLRYVHTMLSTELMLFELGTAEIDRLVVDTE